MKRFLTPLALLLLAACAPAATDPQASGSSSSAFEQRTFTLKTDRYVNDAHGFSLTASSGATVWEREEYIRLQNYEPGDDEGGLAPGEYYVEIHVATEPSEECADGVLEGKEVTIDGATGYRGMGPTGGDAGGTRFALCVESDDRQFFVIVTEDDEEGAIANAVLDSFRLER